MNKHHSKTFFTKNTIDDCVLIDIPIVTDNRGNLAVIENGILPFKMQRVYYIFNIPAGAYRGAHAHKHEIGFMIAISGSFKVLLDDGNQKKEVVLNRPDRGLLIPTGIWREIKDFSQGSVCMVVNSHPYNQNDYIRNYDEFLEYFKR